MKVFFSWQFYFINCFLWICLLPDVLPRPTLVLQQQTDVWHLLCTGSPAYPGALFSLYLADNELPIDTHQASHIQHQATFPVPVQDTLMVSYQCQYSVFLGKTWTSSGRSVALTVAKGTELSLHSLSLVWSECKLLQSG